MAEQTSLIAIIPARSGSKRLPGKNIRRFMGHPMLAYAVAAAQNSKLFERVVVTTDDPHIGRIAEWYGAWYLPRPAELATDQASLVDVVLHVLHNLGEEGVKAEAFCQLMPNCPLRRRQDIVEQYHLFADQQRLFQISVVPYRAVYPHWALVCDDSDRGSWLFGREELLPSQELATAYCPTGAVWWIRVKDFIAQKGFYGKPFHLALMDANRGIDIDREEELELADVLLRGLRDRDGACPLEPVATQPYPEEKKDG